MLSNRFPRLTPLLFIAHLVHQEVSRSDDHDVEVNTNPDIQPSHDISLPQHQPMAVDSIEDIITTTSALSASEEEHQNEQQTGDDSTVWYDCRSHALTIERNNDSEREDVNFTNAESRIETFAGVSEIKIE